MAPLPPGPPPRRRSAARRRRCATTPARLPADPAAAAARRAGWRHRLRLRQQSCYYTAAAPPAAAAGDRSPNPAAAQGALRIARCGRPDAAGRAGPSRRPSGPAAGGRPSSASLRPRCRCAIGLLGFRRAPWLTQRRLHCRPLVTLWCRACGAGQASCPARPQTEVVETGARCDSICGVRCLPAPSVCEAPARRAPARAGGRPVHSQRRPLHRHTPLQHSCCPPTLTCQGSRPPQRPRPAAPSPPDRRQLDQVGGAVSRHPGLLNQGRLCEQPGPVSEQHLYSSAEGLELRHLHALLPPARDSRCFPAVKRAASLPPLCLQRDAHAAGHRPIPRRHVHR